MLFVMEGIRKGKESIYLEIFILPTSHISISFNLFDCYHFLSVFIAYYFNGISIYYLIYLCSLCLDNKQKESGLIGFVINVIFDCSV